MKNLKAYKTFFSNAPEGGCALIFAESRNKAKTLFIKWYPFYDAPEYIELSATREKYYDPIAKDKSISFVIECNDDIPYGWPPFYTNSHPPDQ